jgi:hypothetical protein
VEKPVEMLTSKIYCWQKLSARVINDQGATENNVKEDIKIVITPI